MKKRSLILFLLLAFGCVLWYAFFSFEKKSFLTIHLRCTGNISGDLLFSTVLADEMESHFDRFNLEKSCREEVLIFSPYKKTQGVIVTLKNSKNADETITMEYGRDIQGDPSGKFYAILNIMDTHPFISIDSL